MNYGLPEGAPPPLGSRRLSLGLAGLSFTRTWATRVILVTTMALEAKWKVFHFASKAYIYSVYIYRYIYKHMQHIMYTYFAARWSRKQNGRYSILPRRHIYIYIYIHVLHTIYYVHTSLQINIDRSTYGTYKSIYIYIYI